VQLVATSVQQIFQGLVALNSPQHNEVYKINGFCAEIIYFLISHGLEVQTDVNTAQFIDVHAADCLVSCVTATTHDLGRMLDIVPSRTDLPSPDVDVLDICLSDH